jgi:catechol 2,3-dioxygenase-like lactoylglutathione lyase family enzyme
MPLDPGHYLMQPRYPSVYHVHTVAISVANLKQSREWYEKNLGFQFIRQRDFPESRMLTAILGGTGFQLELIENMDSRPIDQFLEDTSQPTLIQGFKKVVIQIRELIPLYEALKQNGVTFVYPDIEETPGIWGKWFMIEDPDGNIFQFIDGKI